MKRTRVEGVFGKSGDSTTSSVLTEQSLTCRPLAAVGYEAGGTLGYVFQVIALLVPDGDAIHDDAVVDLGLLADLARLADHREFEGSLPQRQMTTTTTTATGEGRTQMHVALSPHKHSQTSIKHAQPRKNATATHLCPPGWPNQASWSTGGRVAPREEICIPRHTSGKKG